MYRVWDKSKPPQGPFTLNRDCPQAVGLVAWWPMGGASGSKLVVDEAGRSHLAGTASPMTLGPTGAPTCVFNGSSDVLTAAAAPVSAMPLTLAAWATAGSSSLVGSILSVDAGLAAFGSANFYRLVVVGSVSPKQVRANQGFSGSEAQATYGAGWVAGQEFHTAGVFTSTTSRAVYYNGALGASDTTSLTAPTVSQATLGRHSVTGSEQYWSGTLGEAGVWNVALPAHIIARLYDPGTRFELWYPLRSKKWFTQGAGAYSLAIGQGTYTLTGQDVGLLAQRTLAIGQGTYTLTGQDVGLLAQRTLAIDQGSYTLTGQDVGLLAQRTLTIGQGTYTLTGQDVTLTYTPAGAYSLAVGQGAYSITGQDVGLYAQRVLLLDSGTYTLTGQDVTLTYTPSGSFPLAIGQGTYTLTGQDVGLLAQRTLALEQGTYTLTGEDVGLLAQRTLALEQGTYTLTGQDILFPRTYVLGVGYGAYTLTGRPVTLTYSGAVLVDTDGEGVVIVAADDRSMMLSFENRMVLVLREDSVAVPLRS